MFYDEEPAEEPAKENCDDCAPEGETAAEAPTEEATADE